MSKVYHLKFIQTIPVNIETAWKFFSSPENLPKITPPRMNFRIISEPADKVYAGQVIEYKVKALPGISIYWMTEITQVVDQKYFIDEQRYGPYSLWHHQHHFKEVNGGVEMTDIIHYKIPLWFLGDIANAFFVRNQVKEIFDFRTKKIDEIFAA